MSVDHAILALRAFESIVAGGAAYTFWPWDWRGRKRVVTLKRNRRPYE